ncbi:MAG: general stress protein [Actinomycetota bacterium]|nr:general stress protein [Actinomycetota bacterium]
MTMLDSSTIVAERRSYEDAQADVDRLSDEGFPVASLAIVSRDLRMVEDITGRRDLMRAVTERAWAGAFIGLWIGLLVSILASSEEDVSMWAALLSWVATGIVVGGVLGLVSHLAQRGRRDFSSVGRIEADRYEIWCELEDAERARAALGTTGMTFDRSS